MNLHNGIPLLTEVDAHVASDLYKAHTSANAAFLQRHGPALAGYGRHWGQDPFKLWSRRWEYPYVAQRLLNFGREKNGQPLTILDAGSGVTYFDYYVVEQLPNAKVICVDYDKSYPPMFEAINKNVGNDKVTFQLASLQELPLKDGAIDAVACISVLEHTDRYDLIINEFARVLAPGGQLVLTFDLSLDGKFTLDYATAEKLLKHTLERFTIEDGTDVLADLKKMQTAKDTILSTDAVKKTQPDLLPWRYPAVKAVHDLVKGYGWTGGFRSKSVFCVTGRKK